MEYLGEIDGKWLFVRWDEEHHQVIYSLDDQDVAVYDIDVMDPMKEEIVFIEGNEKDDTIENALSGEIKETIQKMAKEVDFYELRERARVYDVQKQEEILQTIDAEDEDFVSITEMDLDQEVREKKDDKEENEKNEDESEKDEKEYATTGDIKIKQELKVNTLATDRSSLRMLLEKAGKMPHIQGKDFSKLGIVETSEARKIEGNSNNNNSRFSVVAIATDGTVVPINLETDRAEGLNPRESSYMVTHSGEIKQGGVTCRLKLGQGTLSIARRDTIEVGYSPDKTVGARGVDANESIDNQLETKTTYYKTRREYLAKEREGKYISQRRAEELAHEGNTDRPQVKNTQGKIQGVNYKDADGKEHTKSHQEGNEVLSHENLTRIAEEIMKEYPEIEEVFTEKEVIESVEKAYKEGVELEKLKEDLKEDASHFKTRDSR